MATRVVTRRKSKGGFPWGLALIGVGAYLYFQSKGTTSAPPTTAVPALPPSTSTPVTATTQNQIAVTSQTETDRQLVTRAAQVDPRKQFLVFAQTGDQADIAKVANMIRGEWATFGRCNSAQCTKDWGDIVAKYQIYR